MSKDTAQEKTEQATPKRIKDAREKGQVARSRELSTLAVLMAAAGCAIFIGDDIVSGLLSMMREMFHLRPESLMDSNSLTHALTGAMSHTLIVLLPFLILVTVVALMAPLAISGWSFSVKALSFKWEKLDPIKGIGKLFSAKSLIELLKALAKFGIVLIITLILLWNNAEPILMLGKASVEVSVAEMGSMIGWSFLLMSSAMIIIAAVDVPFQLWDHARQLKMTRKEVKDEFKETDGSPELKRRVREVQQQMSRQRMMEAVPAADVVITNPTHYAVALKYDQLGSGAPVVVAKGKDLVAAKIRHIADENDVPILSAPPLSRALYHTTDLNDEIPAGLYLAVAKVLAYIFQFKNTSRTDGKGNLKLSDLPIPDEYVYDK